MVASLIASSRMSGLAPRSTIVQFPFNQLLSVGESPISGLWLEQNMAGLPQVMSTFPLYLSVTVNLSWPPIQFL